MQFQDRKYEVYAVLGSPAVTPWVRRTWDKIATAIDPLVQIARGRPFVEAFQIEPGRTSGNRRPLPFGRVGWSPQSFDLGRPIQAQARRSAEAIATTVDAVLRAYCVRPWGYRDRSTPGFYIDAIGDLTGYSLLKFGPRHQQAPSLSMLYRKWKALGQRTVSVSA